VGYVLRKFPKLSETFVLNEILGLEARGLKVQIFSLLPPRDPRFHDQLSRLRAPVWYVPGAADSRALLRTVNDAAGRFGRRYRRTMARVLASGRPTLVWRFLQSAYVAERAARLGVSHFHAHFATRATTVARLASSLSGLPYSFTAHAVDIYREDVNPRILAKKIHDARFVVTVSEANVEHLARAIEGSRDKLRLIRNGIDLERFTSNGVPNASAPTILSVARLVEKKGCGYLVEACRLLADQGLPFRCVIIGRGNQRRTLLEQIERLGLQGRVQLRGGCRQKEVLKAYRSAYVYALPSIVGSDGNREGLPVSIVEALACNLPVVSTPVAGIPEVVRDGHNGLLVPERDAAALAAALERLLRDRGSYDRLRANARSSVEAEYDLQQTSASLCRLFLEEDA